jgi:thiamine biosynthesis lipoprotein
MGTRFEIVIDLERGAAAPERSVDDDLARNAALAAGEEALREIESWHARLSPFDQASLVSRIHRDAHEHAVVVDPETFALLTLAEEVRRESGGAFDPCVGRLMHAFGFRGDACDEHGRCAIDSSCGLHTHAGASLTLDPASRSVRTRDASVRLDLGAIAKGWALDRAADVLRESGVASAFLHAGTSSALAMGPREWNVMIPGAGVVALRDAAFSLSDRLGQYVERAGERLGHEMDPRTGRPAGGAARAACVASGTLRHAAAFADAWSTAFVVEGGALLERLPSGLEGWVESDTGPRATLGWPGRSPRACPAQNPGTGEGGRCVGAADRSA